jgi:N-acetylmuramoyl-L-alanine amidase
MGIKIEKMLTPYNFSDRNDARRIKYIVIHFFGDLGTALSVARFFYDSYVGASAHYNVDEQPTIYQSVDDEDIAWHCGASRYFHADCRNSNSLGIEVRHTKINKNSDDAGDTDWYFLEETIVNTLQLVWLLMDKYDIPLENVIRHYDVTHKYCPRPFMGNDINNYHGVTGNAMWSNFKQRLQNRSEVDEMDVSKLTDEQVDQLIERISTRLASKKASDYAVEASKKAVSSGVFSDGNKDGLIDNPQGFVKRQDLAVVMNNAKLLEKK